MTLRGLVPRVGKGRDAREVGVIEWERWDGANGRYELRDEAGRIARIEGKRAVVELSSMRERVVAGRAWRRAFERAWREGTIEHVCRARSEAWAMRFMGMMVVLLFAMAAWMFVPGIVARVWGGVSTWMDVAVIVGIGGMLLPVVIVAALLWDVREVWTGAMPRELRMTREGVSFVDRAGQERAYAWEDCERVRTGIAGVAWFREGSGESERVTLLGLGVKGSRMLGLVREEIDARDERPVPRSMFVPLLIGLCVLHGVMLATSGVLAGAGQRAIPWGMVVLTFVVGVAAPGALVGVLFFGARTAKWWERKRRLARRRSRG